MPELRSDARDALRSLRSESGLHARYARVALHVAVSASDIETERRSLAQAEEHLVQALTASGTRNLALESAYKLTRKAIRDALD